MEIVLSIMIALFLGSGICAFMLFVFRGGFKINIENRNVEIKFTELELSQVLELLNGILNKINEVQNESDWINICYSLDDKFNLYCI